MAGRVLKPCEETVIAVSSVLSEDGLVVYPSDTVYGILANARSRKACRKLALLKGYLTPRPFIVLAKSIDEAISLTSRKSARSVMEMHWPGPVTLVLPASPGTPEWLSGKGGGVALRVPADPLSKAILRETSMNLVSTSANLSGGVDPVDLSQIPASILEGVQMVIDGGSLQGRKPSKVIDLTESEPRILR